MQDWDKFFMGMAEYVGSASKDPSTKVGSVIVDNDGKSLLSMGYNGFPKYVDDLPERLNDRKFKLAVTVHAELNAILNSKTTLCGSKLYSTLHPCAQCAVAIVQAGIRTVIIPERDEPPSWKESFKIARIILEEAGVEVKQISYYD